MHTSATYRDRIEKIVIDWSLLTSLGDAALRDPRMHMVLHQLDEFEADPSPSPLCADGSPLEFCERISNDPQTIALTLEPARSPKNSSQLQTLSRLLSTLVTRSESSPILKLLKPYSRDIRSLWIGVDFAQLRGVRIYCRLNPEASKQFARSVEAGEHLPLSPVDPSPSTRQSLLQVIKRGTLRVVGLNCCGRSEGTKLAFAHPLDRAGVEQIADDCGIPTACLSQYMQLLSSSGGVRPSKRCGLALALSEEGFIQGFTVYHHTAPYFRDDQELRRFVLRLSHHFPWDVTAYRFTSRLFDQEGVRMRTLLGFSTSITGQPSLRLYSQSGTYLKQPLGVCHA